MSDEIAKKISTATVEAMKAKQPERVMTLRLMTSAIKQEEINQRSENKRNALTDDQILTVLERMVKQRQDSIEQYQKANRDDLANKEKLEIEIIREFMPALLSEQQLTAIIDQCFAEIKPKGNSDMGLIMNYLKKHLKTGQADMRMVNTIVKNRLQNL